MAFNKNKVMDSARRFVEKGQVDRAIKEYLRVVGEDPQDVRVWLKIGDLYAKKGSKQDATETYLKVAKFYSEQGFYLKAVAVYKQILKLDARLVEVNLKLAELYRQLGLLSDAMQHFEMVAAHFHREGKTTEALATVRQLVELDPDNVATRIKLAELYSKEEMIEDAVTEFRHACDFLRSHNRQDDFIKVAERLLWHKPDAHDLNRELSTLYLRRSDPRRALQKLQACFKADPRDVETLALLAQAFQALDQKPKTVSVLKELARVLDEDGQKAQCADVHRKILMYVPDDEDSLAYLGKSKPQPKPKPKPEPEPPRPEPRLRSPAPGRVSPPLGVPREVPAVGSAATRQPRGFAITSSDLPPPDIARNATGSVSLVDPAKPRPAAQFGRARSMPTDEGEDFADFALEESSSGFDTGTAAGEVHEEEIVKILTETDVYVKYGLHQKAIDHLRRVFELDPDNVEARERLKEIFISQGREGEAINELIHLAEQAIHSDPAQAERYLREILGLDATHAAAFELGERHGLSLASAADVEIVEDFSDAIELSGELGTIAAVEEEEIDFADLGFEDDSLQGGVVPIEPEYETADVYADDAFEFSLDDLPDESVNPNADELSAVTQEVSLEQVESMVSLDDPPEELSFENVNTAQHGLDEFSFEDAQAFDADLEEDEFGFEPPAVGRAAVQDRSAGGDRAFPAVGKPAPPTDEFSFDTASSDQEFSLDDDQIFGDEVAGDDSFAGADYVAEPYHDPNAFAPHAAPTYEVSPSVVDEFADLADPIELDPDQMEPIIDFDIDPVSVPTATAPVDAHTFDAEPIADVGRVESDFGLATPPVGSFPAPEPTRETVDETMDGSYELLDDVVEDDADAVASASLEDDLDEADFFVGQGLYSEARDILDGLLARYPGHPLVTAKLQDVTAMELASGGRAASQIETPPMGTEADDLADGIDDALSTIEDEPPARPSVMLERPVADGDADTHYDLGLAYKEMGLYDEAIRAFDKVSNVAERAVQCYLMIGLCHREQRNLSEAIHHFKTGLHETTITEREKHSLYYEIGSCYEDLKDPAEAIYYFDMIYKKDGDYRDVAKRVAKLKAATGKNGETDTRPNRAAPDDSAPGGRAGARKSPRYEK